MEIQQEIRKGTIIVFITKYSGILVGLGINSFLARLLSPSEFGIVGVVTVFVTFFTLLSDIGFGPAIVQNQTLEPKDISDIFKISIVLSLILAIIFGLCSYAIAWFYDNKIYIKISQLLAISVFFSSLSVVPRGIMIKNQAFKIIGIIEVCTTLFTGLLAIILAQLHFSYYAIVWRSVVFSVIIFMPYFLFSKLKIFPGFSFLGVRKIAKYSSYQFAFNFINYFSRNLDNILIGKYIGNAGLGIYNQSYQLMMYPIANLTSVVAPVLHPVLAKFQTNVSIIFREYLKVVNIFALLGIPISIFIFFSAHEIVIILLGSKWEGVVPVLEILSLCVWAQIIMSSCGPVFQATGRTDLLFISGLLSAITMVSSILFGVLYFKSIEHVAILLVVAFYINLLQVFYFLTKYIMKGSPVSFIRAIVRNVPAAVLLIIVYLIVGHFSQQAKLTYQLVILLLLKLTLLAAIIGLFNFSTIKKLLKGAV